MAGFLRHFNFLSKKLSDKELEAVFDYFSSRVAFEKLAVHIATSYIANALSQCEIKVFERGEETRGTLYYRLNVSPNDNQNGAQMVNDLVTKVCTDKDALIVPKGNMLYLADSFVPVRRPAKEHLFENVTIDDLQLAKSFRAGDCYYFKLNNSDVHGLIRQVYEDYGKLMAAAIEGFKQGHGRKFKLKLDTVKVGDEKFTKDWESTVKKDIENFMKSENAVYPQYAGYDLEEMKHEADSAGGDVVTMRKEIFDLVAQAYKIPISMMYGTTNNTNDVIGQFLTFAVDPFAQMMSDELTRKSFTYSEWLNGSKVIVDTKKINHVDIFNIAEKIDKLISSGVFCIDDVLVELGYQPLNTEFSKQRFMTKNYALVEDVMNALDTAGGGETR